LSIDHTSSALTAGKIGDALAAFFTPGALALTGIGETIRKQVGGDPKHHWMICTVPMPRTKREP